MSASNSNAVSTNSYNLYDSEYTAPPFGLNNNGAICWWNALIQIILGMSSVCETILNTEKDTNTNLAKEYYTLLRALLPNNPEYEQINTAQFAGASSRLLAAMLADAGASTALGYGQQCASEGFSTCIEMLRIESIDNLLATRYVQSIECTRCKKIVSVTRDTANNIKIPPTKNLRTESEIAEWKNYKSSLPSDHPHHHVIANFTTGAEFEKWVKNHAVWTLGYTCSQCNYKMPTVPRGESLVLLREVIVMSFDMFNKIDSTWYPQELNFVSIDGTILHYELIGKICWSGSINKLPDGRFASGGHYWAHTLREGKWFCCNDGSVTQGDPRPCANTFMIAYHLMSNDKPGK